MVAVKHIEAWICMCVGVVFFASLILEGMWFEASSKSKIHTPFAQGLSRLKPRSTHLLTYFHTPLTSISVHVSTFAPFRFVWTSIPCPFAFFGSGSCSCLDPLSIFSTSSHFIIFFSTFILLFKFHSIQCFKLLVGLFNYSNYLLL